MTYQTIEGMGRGKYKSRGSKFYSFLHPINNLDNYRHLISVYRSEYPEACHICSAYRLFINSRIDEQGMDDGEPRGSSGQPILNQLKKNNLINVGIYVVRIFGGTLLGIPGLIESYSNAALISIDSIKHLDWFPTKNISLSFSYDQQGIVESIIKEFYGVIIKKDFSEDVRMDISINEDKINSFNQKIKEISSGRIKSSIN